MFKQGINLQFNSVHRVNYVSLGVGNVDGLAVVVHSFEAEGPPPTTSLVATVERQCPLASSNSFDHFILHDPGCEAVKGAVHVDGVR